MFNVCLKHTQKICNGMHIWCTTQKNIVDSKNSIVYFKHTHTVFEEYIFKRHMFRFCY